MIATMLSSSRAVLFLVAKGLNTDGGFREWLRKASQGLDLCKCWLRAASRNTFTFANWFHGGSCVARARYHGPRRLSVGFAWASRGLRGGFAWLRETGPGIPGRHASGETFEDL